MFVCLFVYLSVFFFFFSAKSKSRVVGKDLPVLRITCHVKEVGVCVCVCVCVCAVHYMLKSLQLHFVVLHLFLSTGLH